MFDQLVFGDVNFVVNLVSEVIVIMMTLLVVDLFSYDTFDIVQTSNDILIVNDVNVRSDHGVLSEVVLDLLNAIKVVLIFVDDLVVGCLGRSTHKPMLV